jgi:hypothetical protein
MEAYDEELEKIIGELELELDNLLKQRKNMFFTFRLDTQILRIRNLLKKHKGENKKSKEKPQIKKTIAFIRGLIRRILGLNSTASKILKERKQIKKIDDKEDSESKDEKEETKQKGNKEEVGSKNNDTKSDKKKPKEQKLLGKESLFTHVSKEDLGLIASIHPKTLDVHLLPLLELEKSASEFTSKYPKKEMDIKIQSPNNKEIDSAIHLNEDIKKYHDSILNILNKPTRVDMNEDQLHESNSYNIKQLYLLNNYLLHNQERKSYEGKSSFLEFIPLLVTPLLKLEVLMQAIKKYITSSSWVKKQKVTAEKTKLDAKEYSSITRLQHLARIKTQQDTTSSYVEKHKQGKAEAHRNHGSLK